MVLVVTVNNLIHPEFAGLNIFFFLFPFVHDLFMGCCTAASKEIG